MVNFNNNEYMTQMCDYTKYHILASTFITINLK